MSKLFIGKSKNPTSWQKVSNWYNKTVNIEGSYYHQHVIIPGVLKLLNLSDKSSVLDLACGQGVLERKIPTNIYYQGLDAASDLIKFAQQNKVSDQHHFQVVDVTKPFPISKFDFTHAVIILAVQNLEHPKITISQTFKHLTANGKLILVINHPCFRIPKHSGWDIDQKNKIQYRKIDRYLSSIKIPIDIHPGLKQNSPQTPSYHYSLSYLSKMLYENDFVIEKIEEWVSDKVSVGPAANMENIARQEFPLFMAIEACKA